MRGGDGMEWEWRERLDVSTYLFWHGTSLPIRTYYWRTVSVCLLLLSAVRVPIPSSAQPKVSQSIDGADGHCFFRETSSMRKEGMEGGRNVVVWVLFPLRLTFPFFTPRPDGRTSDDVLELLFVDMAVTCHKKVFIVRRATGGSRHPFSRA